ncbi:MAG: hypothetical protein EB084_13615 [Proteobacteria bacterium]|nr:hypothetical protein [Pseudomonadota bacterium]
MRRRELLTFTAALATAGLTGTPLAWAGTDADARLLDEIERRAFRFFWEQADPRTGQVKDRARSSGTDTYTASSIAATGFGLTALCIAHQRGYAARDSLRERVATTLRFIAHELPHEHGFFYHFVDMRDGRRMWKCELSTIDTAILLCGVLTCRRHFAGDVEITALATQIYERVEWPWFLNGGQTLSMGWTPESGFLASRWSDYCELMMLYLLGLGSPTHPLPSACWRAWKRSRITFDGLTYISSAPSLFIHQYSHAWYDFRDRVDDGVDWFQNSVTATEAHERFCLAMHDRFPDYKPDLWGITASDSVAGYVSWGGPPAEGRFDGTIVPCAAGGSIPFRPDACLRVLHTIRDRHGAAAWGRYGFIDAFNPLTGWVNPDVVGIDVGITMLMAENHRSGFVWRTFMSDPSAVRAMARAGFRKA